MKADPLMIVMAALGALTAIAVCRAMDNSINNRPWALWGFASVAAFSAAVYLMFQ